MVSLFACLTLAVGSLAVGWPQAAAPVMAQTTNQSYDCGSYGAGNYGSNDCVATNLSPTPTPVPSATPTKAGIAGLPGTGAHLLWAGIIGLGLILLGLGLAHRHTTSSKPPLRS